MFYKYILSPFIKIAESYCTEDAFCINERFYSYAEFAGHISKIRKALQSSEHQSKNIGLVANDDIETYSSIFAIWLEGLAYVPLHPHQPAGRNVEIINQAKVELILDSGNKNLFPEFQIIQSSGLEYAEFNLQPVQVPDGALAYILFTSGSTGRAKGVPITRSNLGAFMKSFSVFISK